MAGLVRWHGEPLQELEWVAASHDGSVLGERAARTSPKIICDEKPRTVSRESQFNQPRCMNRMGRQTGQGCGAPWWVNPESLWQPMKSGLIL